MASLRLCAFFPYRRGLLAAALSLTAACAADAAGREVPDAKGRTPSEILEALRHDQELFREREQQARDRFEEVVAAARLPGQGAACAVHDLWSGRCAATVDRFNSDLASLSAPVGFGSLDADALGRLAAVYRAGLVERYASAAWQEALFEASGRRDEAMGLATRRLAEYEKPLADSLAPLLPALGRRWRDALVQRHPGNRLEILASTDSAFLDSLHFALTAGGRHRPAEEAGWRAYTQPMRDAPPELARTCRALATGRWSSPQRIGFGWAMARRHSSGHALDTTLAATLPYLLQIALLPVPSEAPEARARARFAAGPARYLRPDTVTVEALLHPLPHRVLRGSHRGSLLRSHKGGSPPAGLPGTPVPDRLPFATSRPLRLQTTVLPPRVRDFLRDEARCCPGDTLEGADLEYGRWSFRILESRPGRGSLDYREARSSLLAELAREDSLSLLDGAIGMVDGKLRSASETILRNLMEEEHLRTADGGSPSHGPFEATRLDAWIREHIRLAPGLAFPDPETHAGLEGGGGR